MHNIPKCYTTRSGNLVRDDICQANIVEADQSVKCRKRSSSRSHTIPCSRDLHSRLACRDRSALGNGQLGCGARLRKEQYSLMTQFQSSHQKGNGRGRWIRVGRAGGQPPPRGSWEFSELGSAQDERMGSCLADCLRPPPEYSVATLPAQPGDYSVAIAPSAATSWISVSHPSTKQLLRGRWRPGRCQRTNSYWFGGEEG